MQYNYNFMNATDEIRLRLRISKLEAKLAFAEIEVADSTPEIASPRTPAQRRDGAVARRDNAEAADSALRAELEVLRRSYPTLASRESRKNSMMSGGSIRSNRLRNIFVPA